MPTYPFEFIKLDQHDGLLRAEVSSESFSDVWDQLEDDGQRLRGESCRGSVRSVILGNRECNFT